MELTKEEKAWVKKVNKLLAQCPSERLGFFTTGDAHINIYDHTHEEEILEDGGDLIIVAQENDWLSLEELHFPRNVHGVCG